MFEEGRMGPLISKLSKEMQYKGYKYKVGLLKGALMAAADVMVELGTRQKGNQDG